MIIHNCIDDFCDVLKITDVGGFRAAVRHVYNKQGVRGFWRGNGLSMLKSSPEFAIKFSMYDFTKRQLKASRNDGRLNARDRFVAGAVAGVFSQTFLYPLDARNSAYWVLSTHVLLNYSKIHYILNSFSIIQV